MTGHDDTGPRRAICSNEVLDEDRHHLHTVVIVLDPAGGASAAAVGGL